MIGLAEVGIYTTAVYFTSILMVSAKSFYRVTGPALANFWKDKEMKNIQKLYTNVTLVNTILGGLIFTLIWASITDIYTIMPDAFLAGKMVFLLYGIGRMVDLISGVNNTILVNSPKYKFSTYLNLLYTVLMVVLNLIFIPIWGMNGAAFATLISLSLFNILKAGSLYHYFRLHPFHKKFRISLVLVLLLFAIGNLLPSPFSPVVNIVFKSTVLGLVYLAMLYFTGLFNFLMKLGKKPK
jgi:O-antigen/teichoic acid export membrane protein